MDSNLLHICSTILPHGLKTNGQEKFASTRPHSRVPFAAPANHSHIAAACQTDDDSGVGGNNRLDYAGQAQGVAVKKELH